MPSAFAAAVLLYRRLLQRSDDGVALDILEVVAQAAAGGASLASAGGPVGPTARPQLDVAARISPPVVRVIARSKMFSSSRTLPGNA